MVCFVFSFLVCFFSWRIPYRHDNAVFWRSVSIWLPYKWKKWWAYTKQHSYPKLLCISPITDPLYTKCNESLSIFATLFRIFKWNNINKSVWLSWLKSLRSMSEKYFQATHITSTVSVSILFNVRIPWCICSERQGNNAAK